ncbi:hypothetical protein LCGC14_0566610 [marine sediment metagenome]|uniref:Zinc-ribbon domain-containing protein n=1 Tax=marine sediment metagenome TaxID=412755 RepID=A0A0F9RKB1_9ZZZZ|nr:MAG: hypothetical protein Lokiarch_08110 [Candidatus Lokiarchaeum sp. GC14_75]
MFFQTNQILDVLADIIGAIVLFLKPIVVPIGQWMVSWINGANQFLKDNYGNNLTIYIIISAILVISGILVNIIWPGDKPSSTFQKDIEKTEELDDKGNKDREKNIIDEIKRCKDCGNPVGDSEICPLCGARQL